MARIEHKYLVSLDALDRLRRALQPYLRLDDYAARNASKEYTVRSIYFDTINLDFFHEAIEGLRTRKKIRVRGYDHYLKNAMVFLEIKKKTDCFITKHRSPVEYESLMPLMATGDVQTYVCSTNGNGRAAENAKRFLFQVNRLSLRPYILIVYEREAYYSKFHHDLRITFDKNIRSMYRPSLDSLYKEKKAVLALPRSCILEVKSIISYPSWLQHILGEFELKMDSLSKYTLCIDSHHRRQAVSKIISNSHFSWNGNGR
jgi:hypothetical protein